MWMAYFTLQSLYPRGKNPPDTHFQGVWVGSGGEVEWVNPCFCQEKEFKEKWPVEKRKDIAIIII